LDKYLKKFYLALSFIKQLKVGEVRPRTEFRNGFKTPTSSENDPAFFTEQRSRLYFDYKEDKFKFRFGRQIISYDNQRILGGLEWAQQGRRHDAFLFLYEDPKKKSKLHAADSTTFAKQTLGAVGSYKVGNVTIGGDFYYQMGKIGSNDLGAMLAGINFTYKTKLTPLKFGVEYISGQDMDAESSKVTNFSPDFGTNHAHNGLMDYFFVGPANGNVGVTDFYLKTKFKLKKGSLTANFHEFLTGSTQFDSAGEKLSAPMGFEIDLVYGVELTKGVKFNLGFSQLFATDTMLDIRPGNEKSNNWAWMMLTFKPTLFKSKPKVID